MLNYPHISLSNYRQPKNTCKQCVSAGVLACLDGYMNIAIEQTEEYVNGQLKNKYGDAFLRGNNGKIIQL